MHFEVKKVIVGGSAGIGRQAAVDAADHGSSAVIVGRSKARVDDTVAELMSRPAEAWGIAAELTDRAAIAELQCACRASRRRETSSRALSPACASKPFLPKRCRLGSNQSKVTLKGSS